MVQECSEVKTDQDLFRKSLARPDCHPYNPFKPIGVGRGKVSKEIRTNILLGPKQVRRSTEPDYSIDLANRLRELNGDSRSNCLTRTQRFGRITTVLLLRSSTWAKPKFQFAQVFQSLPLLTKPVVVQQTLPRPDGVTFLGVIALLAGIMLAFAGISLAIPWYPRWDYGPGLVGAWIILSFGYVGFGQYLPPFVGSGQFLTTGFLTIIILAILYFASGIGFFSGRRWAWTLGITLALFGVASSILQIITWAEYDFFTIPGLIVTVLILVYLISPLARNFFFKVR